MLLQVQNRNEIRGILTDIQGIETEGRDWQIKGQKSAGQDLRIFYGAT